MRRVKTLLACLVLVALLPGCSGSDVEERPAVPEGWETLTTEIGEVSYPGEWQARPERLEKDAVGSFDMVEGGESVGQLDVYLNNLTEDLTAERLALANNAQEALVFQSFRNEAEGELDVPNGTAYFYRSTYELTGTDTEAIALEASALRTDSRFLTVKITGLQTAYAPSVWRGVLDTLWLEPVAGDS